MPSRRRRLRRDREPAVCPPGRGSGHLHHRRQRAAQPHRRGSASPRQGFCPLRVRGRPQPPASQRPVRPRLPLRAGAAGGLVKRQVPGHPLHRLLLRHLHGTFRPGRSADVWDWSRERDPGTGRLPRQHPGGEVRDRPAGPQREAGAGFYDFGVRCGPVRHGCHREGPGLLAEGVQDEGRLDDGAGDRGDVLEYAWNPIQPRLPPLPGGRSPGRSLPAARRLGPVALLPEAAADGQWAIPRAPNESQ
ncbi:hypothetical protein VTI74DRAFT_2874 [Chaetomium olivicolor]